MVGSFRIGAIAAFENAELGFLAPFLCWRFSERVGFREGGRWGGLSRSSRIELKVPAEHFSISLIPVIALVGCFVQNI